jgi:hypothetical protein
MNIIDFSFELLHIRNLPTLVVPIPPCSPYTLSANYAHLSFDCVNSSIDCTNFFVDYANKFDDCANTPND